MTSVPRSATPGGTWYVRLLLLEGRVVHFSLAVLFLSFDYVTGPSIHAAITYIIPVAAASWFARPSYAYTLAVLQPLVRTLYPHLWGEHVPAGEILINFIIRVSVLLIVAWLIGKASLRTRALAREVEMLEDILPICRVCKRVRDSKGEWLPAESLAPFNNIPISKGRDICPDCWH